MARDFQRSDRVGAQIQKELSVILKEMAGEISDLGLLTVQEARVAKDLSHAKIYFTVLGGQWDGEETAKFLNAEKAGIRYELGHRLRLRIVPSLKFQFDTSMESGNRLASLINQSVSDLSDDDTGK